MFGQKNVMPSANKKNGLILLFSVVLKRFCPLDSKNVFVFVLAHLEPELELFEVWEIMVLQIIITIIANVIDFVWSFELGSSHQSSLLNRS